MAKRVEENEKPKKGHQKDRENITKKEDKRKDSETKKKKKKKRRSSLGAQWVKDPGLPLLWPGLLLWCGFSPWPGNFRMPGAWPNKTNQREWEKTRGSKVKARRVPQRTRFLSREADPLGGFLCSHIFPAEIQAEPKWILPTAVDTSHCGGWGQRGPTLLHSCSGHF